MKAEVAPGQAGERLDIFLAGPLGSRARAQSAIAAGAVTVNGSPAAKSRQLEPGDLVEWDEVKEAPAIPEEDAGAVPFVVQVGAPAPTHPDGRAPAARYHVRFVLAA